MAVRAMLGVVALTFLLGALALAHVAGWYWLRLRFGWRADTTAVLLAAGDLLVAGVLALVAARLGPGPAEIQARLVRHRAWRALTEAMEWPLIMLRLLRLLRKR